MILRACILWLALATTAAAADLRVQVLDASARPVHDAVVTVHLQQRSAAPIRFSWPMRIAQRGMQFDPFVLIAPAGASVAFPNNDDVRHQVYSFSEAGPFELRLYGRDESRSVTFRDVGVISIGCNIHDRMSAFIYIVDTPFAAKTGSDGTVNLSDIPEGLVTVRVWHPYMRATANRVDRQIQLAAATTTQRFDIRLRPPPDQAHGY